MVSAVVFSTQWRGQRDTWRRRFFALMVASTLLHLPLSPLFALLTGLSVAVTTTPAPAAPAEVLNAIPIELIEDNGREPPPGEKPGTMTVVEEPGNGQAAAVLDAGVPDEPKDAGVEDAGVEDADVAAAGDAGVEPTDAGIEDGGDGIQDAGTDAIAEAREDAAPPPRVRNPVAVAAKSTKVVDSNAAVSLTVYCENIRKHPLGPRIGALMAHLPQWRDFFGPSSIDPLRDIDRIMLVGPDFLDTSGLGVLIQHHLPPARIHEAIDALVRRPPGGQWLDAGVPAAQARADRAERVFVMSSSRVVAVVPLAARDSTLGLSIPRLPPPEGKEALFGTLRAPGYAFAKHGVPLQIPDTIQSLEYWVTPLPDGGGRAHFVATDVSAKVARQSLDSIKQQIDSLATLGGLAGLGALLFQDRARQSGLAPADLQMFVAVLSRFELSVHGNEIHGSVEVPRQLAEAIVARVEREFGMNQPATPAPKKE